MPVTQGEDGASQAFGEKRYSFPGGISVTAATMPVSALLSLNGATVDELYMMFTEAAGMPNAAAIKLVDGVVTLPTNTTGIPIPRGTPGDTGCLLHRVRPFKRLRSPF